MDIEKNKGGTPVELSPEARVALINFGGSRQGTKAPQGLSALVLGELHFTGLLSARNNLTSLGGIVRDRVLDEKLREL